MSKTRQISVAVSAPTVPTRVANPGPRKRNAATTSRAHNAAHEDFIVDHPEAAMALFVGLGAGVMTGAITESVHGAAIGASLGIVAGGIQGHRLRKQRERRASNPAAFTLGVLGVIGLGSYATWRLIHEGNKQL